MKDLLTIVLGTIFLIMVNILLGIFTSLVIEYKGDLQYVAYIVNVMFACGVIYFDAVLVKWYINKIRDYVRKKKN